MWLCPWVNLFKKTLICVEILRVTAMMCQTAYYELHTCKNIIVIEVDVGLLLLHETVDRDETKLFNAGVVDSFHPLRLAMNLIKGHWLSRVFRQINRIAVCEFNGDRKRFAIAANGGIGIVATDAPDAVHLSRTDLQAEIFPADILEATGDKVSQSGCYILAIESFCIQYLKCTGVFIDIGLVEPQQIIAEFVGCLLVIVWLVDRNVAR